MFKISVCIFGDGVGEGDEALCARLERVLAFLAETGVHEVLLPFDDALARIALLAAEKLRDRYEIVCSGACMAHSPQCRALKRGGVKRICIARHSHFFFGSVAMSLIDKSSAVICAGKEESFRHAVLKECAYRAGVPVLNMC